MSEHIFVVDDDAAVNRLTSLTLRYEGFDVQAFTSPVEALSHISDATEEMPAAVILDLNMPEMDGREFYRLARQAGMCSPVLILSSYGAEAAKLELGAEAAVAKPFDPTVLSDELRRLLPLHN